MSGNSRPGSWDLAAYLLPIVVVVSLFATYLLNPDFYIRYVLAGHLRERQIVEILTFVASLVGEHASVFLRLEPLAQGDDRWHRSR